MSSNFKLLLFQTSKYEVNFTRREYWVSSHLLCAESLDLLMGFLILILRLRVDIERHTNEHPIFRIWISEVGQNNTVTGVGNRRIAYRVANGPNGSRVRANVVMRSREPGARKLVFFKLLPSRKPEQESYNCILPPPSFNMWPAYLLERRRWSSQTICREEPDQTLVQERLKQNTI